MTDYSDAQIRDISRMAQQLRIDVLEMVYGAGSGHLGGAFSAAEIVAAMHFGHPHVDPLRPDWPERDRFILSKDHASAVLYAALARRGFFPVAELPTFRHLGSRLNGHPDRHVPGVEVVAGPLGHGVALGTGMALALSMDAGKPSARSAPSAMASRARVYVLLGDGELNAGVVWEGAMAAAKYRLGNLVAIVDANGVQDGMAFDTRGRLWVCGALDNDGGQGIFAYAPDGGLEVSLGLPAGSDPTNLCIGDGGLCVTLGRAGALIFVAHEAEPARLLFG